MRERFVRGPAGAAALAASLAAASCAGSAPPAELGGLWSAGPAACEAGIGVRFSRTSVTAHYAGETQTLLSQPDYALERRGERLRVQITYVLPETQGLRGVLLLERGADGQMQTLRHRIEDTRTGAARVRFAGDPVAAAFRLRQCGQGAWAQGLRGRQARLKAAAQSAGL